MTTHTPKLTPPRVYKDPSGNIYRIAVYAEGGRTFHAVTQTDLLNRDWDRALSDAHLIAAASDLLKQLKSARLMLHAWRNTCPDHGELISAINDVEAAIAKANGDEA